MTAERWNEIYEGFVATLDQKPGDRTGYLNETFAHDAHLRDEIASLLRDAQEAEDEGFLLGPAWIMDDIPLFLPDFQNGDSKFSTIEYIGHGGMGVVYKAYQSNFDRWVALKLSSPHMTNAADKDRFRAEAQSIARLRHSNIVTVHETGEYHGRPYFVMELVEGKSLRDRLPEFTEHPRKAAALVQQIAFAVHHAHQRRILHNDLKPGNILLNEEGKPHVTDFGLAKRLAEGETSSVSRAGEGTASYMSPEQADGKELTTATDVYGLGAILYTLLTGTPPFKGETVPEILELVRTETPKPPRALNPKVDSTLEAICLKCLKKDKAERYASANSVALDIGRYLDGRETLAQPWNRRGRFLGWCRRNRMEAGLVGAVAAIWIFAVVMALSVAQTRKADLLEATLQGASFAAEDLATTALLQLRYLGRDVEGATVDPRLPTLLASDDRMGLQQLLSEVCPGPPSPFMSCYVLNDTGTMVAHLAYSPFADDVVGDDFSWRDYFLGAKRLAAQGDSESVHISRVYRGRSDNLYKFAVSAPILDSERNFLGLIATTVTTDATMGPVFLHDENRQVALIAPRDIESPALAGSTPLDRHVVLFHPAYRQGFEAVELPDLTKTRLQLGPIDNQSPQLSDSDRSIPPDDNYTDPVSSVAEAYAGRWIAGFAPVGNTGFIVVVQQSYADAVILETSTFWSLALWSALASLVALAILGMVLWRWSRSQRLEPELPVASFAMLFLQNMEIHSVMDLIGPAIVIGIIVLIVVIAVFYDNRKQRGELRRSALKVGFKRSIQFPWNPAPNLPISHSITE